MDIPKFWSDQVDAICEYDGCNNIICRTSCPIYPIHFLKCDRCYINSFAVCLKHKILPSKHWEGCECENIKMIENDKIVKDIFVMEDGDYYDFEPGVDWRMISGIEWKLQQMKEELDELDNIESKKMYDYSNEQSIPIPNNFDSDLLSVYCEWDEEGFFNWHGYHSDMFLNWQKMLENDMFLI